MARITLLQRLTRKLQNEGVAPTAHRVTSFIGSRIEDRLEGRKGYYRLNRRRLLRRYGEEAITPIWVPPEAIIYLTGPYERRDRGHLDYVPYFKPPEANWDHLPYTRREISYRTTVAGDWDHKTAKFSELFMAQGVRQRFRENRPWDDTIYYKERLKQFRAEGWSQEEAVHLTRERCSEIEQIYKTIQREGYCSQEILRGSPLHEVTVNIDRDGNLLYNSQGRHRLSIAKVLDVKKIPVLILGIHAKYDGNINNRIEGKADE